MFLLSIIKNNHQNEKNTAYQHQQPQHSKTAKQLKNACMGPSNDHQPNKYTCFL